MAAPEYSITVPFDFSQSSEIALTYAIQIATNVNSKVYLLYFIEEGGLFTSKEKIQKKEEETAENLKNEIDQLRSKFNFPFHFIVRSGKVKNSLRSFISENNSKLVLTGPAYNANGIAITALEVINFLKDDNVPVIVTKMPPVSNKIREVVLPVEPEKKYKELLKWVIFLAKYYKCNINMVKPYTEDPATKKIIENNVYFSKMMLDSNNIVYGVKNSVKDEIFKDIIFKFANSIQADLLIVMSVKFKEYVCDKNNAIIESERIPVMCINERSDLKNYQGFY